MVEEEVELLEKLRNWGCDVNAAMERFLDDVELYRSCLEMATEDSAIMELQSALQEGNVKAAFDAAHTLKGVLANLGLTPMYDRIVQIVEPLRAGKQEGLLPLYAEFVQANQYLKELLGMEQR